MKQLQLVWAALAGGCLTYTLGAFALVAFAGLSFEVLDPAVVNYVAAAVMLLMGGAVFARRTMVARIPADATPAARLAQYRTVTIVGLAVTEWGGLIIVTLGMLATTPSWILAGGGAAVASMFLARPTADELGLP